MIGADVRRLLAYMAPERGLIVVSALLRIANLGLGVAIPVAAGWVIATAFLEPGRNLTGFLGLLAVAAVVKGACRYLEQLTGHSVAFRLLARLRGEVFGWVERLHPGGLEDRRSGELVAAVTSDVDQLEPFYAHTVAPMISAVAVPALVLGWMAVWVDPALAAILGGAVVLGLLVPWVGSAKAGEAGGQVRAANAEVAAVTSDLVQGYDEVIVLNAEDRAMSLLNRSVVQLDAGRKQVGKAAGIRAGLGSMVSTLTVVAVLVVGSWGVDRIGITGVVMAVIAVWVALGPVKALEQIVSDTEQSVAAAQRLFQLADAENPVVPVVGGQIPQDGSVGIESASLRRGGRVVLDGASLAVAAGEFVGVVGPSGSGKSSLIQLLTRAWDPDTGSVSVGGLDLKTVDTAGLRRQVMVVPQRPDIFVGSIADNMRLANPQASDDQIRTALRRAGLAERFPDIETSIDQFGVGLSGGERQRVALARIYLRDPKVLVLDEATSELDSATESQVLGELLATRGTTTLIVIAHRIDTVRDADRILVVDEGRVVESGTHDGLLAASGLYARLWQRHLDAIETSSG